MKKNRVRKSRDTAPLNNFEHFQKSNCNVPIFYAEDGTEPYEPDYLIKKPIKKASKFYLFFKQIYEENISDENCSLELNSFYSPALLQFVIEQYLPLYPLVSLFFVPNSDIVDLPTTSAVENYWRSVKIFFKNIPINRRYVPVYFPMMLSYFNAQAKEYLLMKKSKALHRKLTNKRKYKDPTK